MHGAEAVPGSPSDCAGSELAEDGERDGPVVVLVRVVVLVEDFVLFGDELGLDVFELVGFFADVADGADGDGASL